MTLETEFQQHFQERGWANPQQRGLVAVSTGVDSMVLLTLLCRLPADQRPQLTVVHVNHELRDQSQEEAAFLTRWCANHEVPLVKTSWPQEQHPTHGIEAAARQFRYQFFATQLRVQGAEWVATAHQADEQVETIVLKLLRGGDLAQLTGMADRRPLATGQVIHPLLPFTKAQLVAYAREHHVTWYEDQTNQQLVASRNRIRHLIMPTLQRENAQVADHLLGYAEQLRATLAVADRTLATKLATIVGQTVPLTGDGPQLLAQPVAEQQLLLARFIKQVAPTASTQPDQLSACLHLLDNPQRPTGTVSFHGGWIFEKNYDTFQFKLVKKLPEKSVEHFSFMVDLNQWRSVGNGWQFGCFLASHHQVNSPHETIALTAEQWPLTVRSWRSDDQLRLATGHHQSVRRALINAKVPQPLRAQQAVLVTATGDVLAILGVKWSVWPPRSHTKNYHIVWKHE